MIAINPLNIQHPTNIIEILHHRSNKYSSQEVLGDIQAIITNFLPHASPPILLQWCRCRGGFCLLGHNPIHILR